MVGMAEFTLTTLDPLRFSMKTLLFRDIPCHKLVAIQTFFVLTLFFEQVMALGTFLFELGMTLDQGSRHQQGFQWIGMSQPRNRHENQN